MVAKDEERYLPATLEAIKGQTISAHRIVLVNDNSTDGTVSIAKQFDCDVVTVPATTKTKDRYGEHINRVRNVGFEYISKDPVEYIVCVDADTVIPPTYCYNIIETMKIHGAVVGSGLPSTQNKFRGVSHGEAGLIIRHDWFYNCVRHLLLEWTTLLVRALCNGDVIVLDSSNKYTLQRGPTPRGNSHYFDVGRSAYIAGYPTSLLLLRFIGFILRGQFLMSRNFVSGYTSHPLPQRHSKQERKVLARVHWDDFCRRRFGRKNSKFYYTQGSICLISSCGVQGLVGK